MAGPLKLTSPALCAAFPLAIGIRHAEVLVSKIYRYAVELVFMLGHRFTRTDLYADHRSLVVFEFDVVAFGVDFHGIERSRSLKSSLGSFSIQLR